MNTLEVDYNSLSPEDKKLFVKIEMERKRAQLKGLPLSVLSPENVHLDGELNSADEPQANDEDSITVFRNKLQAFARAAEELDNAWDSVDGEQRVMNALSIRWPFQEKLYYLALRDAREWANATVKNLNKI